MSDFPEVDRAVAAIVSICPEHTVDGVAVMDLDCGACGSRQDVARIYLLGRIEDARKGMRL